MPNAWLDSYPPEGDALGRAAPSEQPVGTRAVGPMDRNEHARLWWEEASFEPVVTCRIQHRGEDSASVLAFLDSNPPTNREARLEELRRCGSGHAQAIVLAIEVIVRAWDGPASQEPRLQRRQQAQPCVNVLGDR